MPRRYVYAALTETDNLRYTLMNNTLALRGNSQMRYLERTYL